MEPENSIPPPAENASAPRIGGLEPGPFGAALARGISAPLAEQIAGEIKNRLAGIHAVLQLLAREMSADDPERDLVEIAAAGVREIDETAAGLMRLACPPLLQRQETDLRSFLGDLALPWNQAGRESGLSVLVDAPEELVVALDQKRIGKALGELVRRASHGLDGSGEVALVARETEDEIEIEVRDDRSVVSARAARSRGEPRPGVCGLGLLIARLDIEAHGGTLSIDPCSCGGCTRVRLPRRVA